MLDFEAGDLTPRCGGSCRWVRVERDTTGNQAPLPGIFPDQLAPVIRTARDGAREMILMRWGFPPPPNLSSRPVTNVRNTRKDEEGSICSVPS